MVGQSVRELAGNGDIRAFDLPLDVSEPANTRAAAAAIARDPGRLDILVNNAVAEIDASELATSADLDGFSRVLRTNVLGAWSLIQQTLPLLRRSSHPRVVNVSSGAGSHGDPQFGFHVSGGAAAGYAVSKAALNGLTSALAAELADTSILVNAVCPGLTASDGGEPGPGVRSVAAGASSVVWGVTLPAGGPSGGFFRDGQPLPW